MSRGLPFQFDVPIGMWMDKSAPEGRQKRFGGLITTDGKDRQQEIILQKGLDFEPFLTHGWFNDNHSKDTDGIVGFPDKNALSYYQKGAKLPDGNVAPNNGHWAEGYMLENERGLRLWDTAQSLAKAGGDRRLGFSVEGGIQKRTGKHNKVIAKASVKNVAITNCFPGDVRVVGAADKVTRRSYSGQMVEIVLSTGEKLTGTPNHPIFTERGWVALGKLDEGSDHIGRYLSDAIVSAVVSPDEQDVPSTFDEIFDFASHAGLPHRIGPAGEGHFHGDLSTSDVDIVLTDGALKDSLTSAFLQKFGKDALPASDKQLASLPRDGLRHLDAGVEGFATQSSVGRAGESLSLGGGSAGVPTELFVPATPGDPSTLGDVVDGHPADTVTGGDCGRALSKAIGFSNIVSKRVFDFCGHVFNLDTYHGWYEANGIIAHNCPVNTDTRLDTLAKSMMAVEQACEAGVSSPEELWKALGMGTATAGPFPQPAGPQSGETAGQVLAPESLERKKRKDEDAKNTTKSLTDAEAIELVKAQFPLISLQLAGRIVDMARRQKALAAL